jgi:hypothetical protein
VGADQEALLGDVLDEIAEATPEKEDRRAALATAPLPEAFHRQSRWIGTVEDK